MNKHENKKKKILRKYEWLHCMKKEIMLKYRVRRGRKEKTCMTMKSFGESNHLLQ